MKNANQINNINDSPSQDSVLGVFFAIPCAVLVWLLYLKAITYVS